MAEVIRAFACADTGRVYHAGDAYDGTPERIATLAAQGLVVAPPQPKQQPKRTRKTHTKE